MLLGLNGRLKSGKDTTFGIIQELNPEAERVSFADALKDSAAASLGMTRELAEALKEHENISISIAGTSSLSSLLSSELAAEATRWKMTMREFMQWYGTEGHRDLFGDDFWVDRALPKDLDHHGRLLVVTDMRFPNEIQRVKDLGGYCVKIDRNVQTAHGTHASEQNVDHLMDYVLDNTGSLNDLYDAVDEMLGVLCLDSNIAKGLNDYA